MCCNGVCLWRKEFKLNVVRCIDVNVFIRDFGFNVLVKEM